MASRYRVLFLLVVCALVVFLVPFAPMQSTDYVYTVTEVQEEQLTNSTLANVSLIRANQVKNCGTEGNCLLHWTINEQGSVNVSQSVEVKSEVVFLRGEGFFRVNTRARTGGVEVYHERLRSADAVRKIAVNVTDSRYTVTSLESGHLTVDDRIPSTEPTVFRSSERYFVLYDAREVQTLQPVQIAFRLIGVLYVLVGYVVGRYLAS